jgi:hypothetical protein
VQVVSQYRTTAGAQQYRLTLHPCNASTYYVAIYFSVDLVAAEVTLTLTLSLALSLALALSLTLTLALALALTLTLALALALALTRTLTQLVILDRVRAPLARVHSS